MGGWNDNSRLSSVELFPPSDTCSIPDLPQPSQGPSLSLLSGGRLVVCGGHDGGFLDSCIYWVAGNTSWTLFHTMRCLLIIHIYITQSSSSKTITVWRDIGTRRGRHLLFPTPLCCSAGMAVQASLQRGCQVMHSDLFRKKNDFHIFHRWGQL